MPIAVSSHSCRSLFAIAPPVNGLDIVRVIIPPGAAHALRLDVVGNDVGVLGELLHAERAHALLGNDFPVKELPHFAVGSEFPVSSGMLQILDTPNSHLALAPFSWDCFSAAAEERAVDRAELIPAESHVASWLAEVDCVF